MFLLNFKREKYNEKIFCCVQKKVYEFLKVSSNSSDIVTTINVPYNCLFVKVPHIVHCAVTCQQTVIKNFVCQKYQTFNSYRKLVCLKT